MQIPSTAAYLRNIGEIAPGVNTARLTESLHFKVPETKGASTNIERPLFVNGKEKGQLAMLMEAVDEFMGGHKRGVSPVEELPIHGLNLDA